MVQFNPLFWCCQQFNEPKKRGKLKNSIIFNSIEIDAANPDALQTKNPHITKASQTIQDDDIKSRDSLLSIPELTYENYFKENRVMKFAEIVEMCMENPHDQKLQGTLFSHYAREPT